MLSSVLTDYKQTQSLVYWEMAVRTRIPNSYSFAEVTTIALPVYGSRGSLITDILRRRLITYSCDVAKWPANVASTIVMRLNQTTFLWWQQWDETSRSITV